MVLLKFTDLSPGYNVKALRNIMYHKQKSAPYCYACHPSPSNHSFCFCSSEGFQLSLSANYIVVWCIVI